MTEQIFNQEDRKRITAAVQDAEGKTSGEIVPYYVSASDNYQSAEFRGALLLGAGLVCACLGFNLIAPATGTLTATIVAILGTLGGVCGFGLTRSFPALKRILAGEAAIERRVAARAMEAFLTEEVFNTRERTGILLFISALEHRVLVLGDAGINQKVTPGDWDAVIKTVVDGIHAKKAAEGFVAAINQCGEILQKAGVERRHDDTNELPDGLRFGE